MLVCLPYFQVDIIKRIVKGGGFQGYIFTGGISRTLTRLDGSTGIPVPVLSSVMASVEDRGAPVLSRGRPVEVQTIHSGSSSFIVKKDISVITIHSKKEKKNIFTIYGIKKNYEFITYTFSNRYSGFCFK